MKKRIISYVLTLVFILTCLIPAGAQELRLEPAGYGDLEDSVSLINSAIDDLDDVFSPSQSYNFTEIFTDLMTTFRSAGSFLGAVNGCVNFLKLIGVVKDSTKEALANITFQLQTIGEQLDDMDRKLNDLAVQMSQLRASEEFNTRAEKAIMFRSAWRDFEYRYMETGMDALMSSYSSMILNGMRAWCENSSQDARVKSGIDNRSLMLIYEPAGNGYSLTYTTGNDSPATVSQSLRYIELTADVLPENVQWNVNYYREEVIDAIAAKIRAKLETDGTAAFAVCNFPAFTGDGSALPSDALIHSIAEDAANLLIYRVTSAEVNRDSSFSLEVARTFSNYCTHLLSGSDGIDAMYKTMYLTHAFEYQIEDSLTDFCNQMTVKTGTYGSFVLSVLSMSNYVTERESANALSTFCNAVKQIGAFRESGLTGYGTYCYLTNSVLSFGTVKITQGADIATEKHGMVSGYEGYSTRAANVSITYGRKGEKASTGELIGDSDMLLLEQTLKSNGIKADFAYFNTNLGEKAAEDYGLTVVSMNSEQVMPSSNGTSLAVTNVLGKYFAKHSTARLTSLPGDAKNECIKYRRMVTGSAVDTASGELTANRLLLAIALYGESRWYWETDEAAFLGGPSDSKSFTHTCTKELTDTAFPAFEYYSSHYNQEIRYNCIIEKPADSPNTLETRNTPLSSYLTMCREFRHDEEAVSLGGGRQYKITFTVTDFGRTTSDRQSAYAGMNVFLTAKPAKGYTLETLLVKDADGNEVELITDEEGKYFFVMPSSDVSVTSTYMEDNSVLNFYTDVTASDWFWDPVLWSVKNDISKGTDSTHFSPYSPCTRAQVVTFLWRASESPAVSFEMKFDDVSADAWYAEAVRWATSVGITNGTSDTKFSPDRQITREQLATMVYNYANIKGEGSAGEWEYPLSFSDCIEVSTWANKAVQWCVKNGIVNGVSADRLAPKNTANRAEILTMIYRVVKLK